MKAKITATKKRKPKRKLPKVAEIETAAEPEPISNPEPKPLPQPKTKAYTHEDWQKEVAKHVPPGQPIPDWLSAKAP